MMKYLALGKLGIHSTAMIIEETDLLAYRMAERFPETVPDGLGGLLPF